jgi:Protein of unknown function (DUF2877)
MRLLRRSGRGAVELVLRGGAYLRFGDEWLLVTAPGSPFGPLTLAVAGLELAELRPGQSARLQPGRLAIGRQVVSLERARERRTAPRPSAGSVSGSPAGVPRLGFFTGTPPAELAAGLRALERGQVAEGVRLLAGRGDGLTPAGDDVLAGFAAWRHAAGRPVVISASAAERSSPLGLAYLRCAERGELPDPGLALLTALTARCPRRAADAAVRLRGWGASSGAALAWGISAGAAEAF